MKKGGRREGHVEEDGGYVLVRLKKRERHVGTLTLLCLGHAD